jgi:5-formyltetrahydrofolate cyclo-ligase
MGEKTALRRELRALRRAIPPEEKKALDAILVEKALATDVYRGADLLLLYAPLADEPNLLALAAEAWRDGKEVAFPISHTDTHTLTFHTVTFLSELREGAYGIFEPSYEAPMANITSKTLCIVPALAFDRAGYRLGYGGGYYDRLLSDFGGHTLGLFYHAFLKNDLPRGEYDRAIELLITEKEVLSTDEGTKKE